jgi:16S rRNA (guanine966-N2)-methyltransferase
MPSKPGVLRIIAGKWRHRRIAFETTSGIRPTPDRIRETLFSWLQPMLPGATCLDCFAGSGALGFEALSRGASHVTFVDTNALVLKNIQQNAIKLDCSSFTTLQANLPDNHLMSKLPHMDVVFLDPPFESGMLSSCLQWLLTQGCINAESMIYFECEKTLDLDFLHKYWRVLKLKQTKAIQYGLVAPKTP